MYPALTPCVCATSVLFGHAMWVWRGCGVSQVTVMVLLCIVLSPFMGMIGGILWVLIRVLGTYAPPLRRCTGAHGVPHTWRVLPLLLWRQSCPSSPRWET